MTTWEIIREDFTKNETQDSVGYYAQLHKASLLYPRINSNLTDKVESDEAFQNDEKVTQALLMGKQLKDIGVLGK